MPRRNRKTKNRGDEANEKKRSETAAVTPSALAIGSSKCLVDNKGQQSQKCQKSSAIKSDGEKSKTTNNRDMCSSSRHSHGADGGHEVPPTIMPGGLASFRIPKKRSRASKNDEIVRSNQINHTNATSDFISVANEKTTQESGQNEKRKRKHEGTDDDNINKVPKLHHRTGSNQNAPAANACLEDAKKRVKSSTQTESCVPKLPAKHTSTSSSSRKRDCTDITPQREIIDTPQMAALKKLMQDRNKSKKKPWTSLQEKTESNHKEANTATTCVASHLTKTNVCNDLSASRKGRTERNKSFKDKAVSGAGAVAPEVKRYNQPKLNHETNREMPERVVENNTMPSCRLASTNNAGDGPLKATSIPTQLGIANIMATNSTNLVTQMLSTGHSNSHLDTTDVMDVDVFQVEPSQTPKVFIIIDTNVWISHQSLITEILDMTFPSSMGIAQAILIIPWMVLQEIDHNTHRNSDASSKFRSAAKFIHGLLSAKHPRVKGEKATEAIIGMEFNELMADDSILNCAIQYSKLPHNRVVFITNDINLLNKALVHNLDAFKVDSELINNLSGFWSPGETSAISQLEESINNSTTISLPNSPFNTTTLQTPSTSSQFNNALEDIEMDVDDPMGNEMSIQCYNSANVACIDRSSETVLPTFEAVVSVLQQTLTSIIVPKMAEEYGTDGWKFAIKIKPPFTVESGFKCIQAHWIAVFSFMFPSKGKEVVDELVNVFQQKPGSTNMVDLKSWRLNISQMAKILLTLNKNIASRPRVADCCRILQEYIQHETHAPLT